MVKLETAESKASNLDIEVSKMFIQAAKTSKMAGKTIQGKTWNRALKGLGVLREAGKKRTGRPGKNDSQDDGNQKK